MIDPERMERVREVFEAASAGRGNACEAVLDAECEGDPALRATVEELIAADGQPQPLLDSPLQVLAEVGGIVPPGSCIGGWRVIRAIGAGGMGAVYLTEPADGSSTARFALKIVRSPLPELASRLEHERSILSALEHPNIARLTDGGITSAGLPYFVMEYVDGRPICTYANEQRLGVAGRLKRFRQVCSAVHYLHQHLVVHRDLKPGSILVAADGTVKLVDFGVSKLIEAEAHVGSPVQTLAGMLTPDYASPEQVLGRPPSTLTDVYSIGLLLDELLAGAGPYASPPAGLHEILRRVCESEPRKPSAACQGPFARQLRGELDNIVLKALRKEPERRYASVDQMDEDVGRYLAGQPVRAQGDSAVYRARKFVRRNKLAVALGSLTVFALAGGLMVTVIEADVARRAQVRAEFQARRAATAQESAERQTAEALTQRARAEQNAATAQRERANAERRLAELTQLARSAVQAYTSTSEESGGSDDAAMLAGTVRDSLLTLRGEGIRMPGMTDLLDQTSADVSSSDLIKDPSWHVPVGWNASESIPGEYRVGVDHRVVHGGRSSLFLRSLRPEPKGYAVVYQIFSAGGFAGKRVRLAGFLRGERLAGSGAANVLAGDSNGASDATDRTSIAGTTRWRPFDIVIDVPGRAQSIQLTIVITGAGTLWADDFRFEIVSASIPLPERTQPQNMTFTTRTR